MRTKEQIQEYYKEYHEKHYVKKVKERLGTLPEGYVWHEVKGTDGWYYVSREGTTYSFRSGKMLQQKLNKGGYYIVSVKINNKYVDKYVHRLVAETFIPNPYGLRCINHINCIKTDNRVENLEWCSDKYNLNYADAQEKRVKSLIDNKGYLKFRNNIKSMPVLQYSLDGELIREFPSINEVRRELGYHVGDCCHGIKKSRERYGYIWKFKNL